MSDPDRALEQIERAAAELVPQLSERLATHGLGEIEVRRGDLRVRVVASPPRSGSSAPSAAAPTARATPLPSPDDTHAVTAPAVGYFLFADGLFENLEIEVPPGHPCGYGDRLPVEVVLQHRGVSPRRPGAAAMGPFAEPALVDENYDPALIFGLFFNSGQRAFFQRWMAFSSRSSARPVGRWQLQPSRRRIFQTCPG